MAANGIEAKLLVFGGGKSSDRDRRLQFHLRCGLRCDNVTRVADLAMLLVGGVSVPVAGSLHGKQAHGKNQGHGQQS
jgi:hypothetical protein